ncbi:hypothetical protein BD779DRAFT_1565247 [Infundibulicybe gibba]|nr:hypothetical protein BD779DRAFT_1565247 [Infundibulicybe gibba]
MPAGSMDPRLANPLKSTQNDILESPAPEELPKAAMRFRTMISLMCLLDRVLHIGSTKGRRYSLLLRAASSRRRQRQLRILGALATVLVRRDEVVAVAGSLERVFVAYNLASPKSDRPKANPTHTHIPKPDELSLEAVMTYLVSSRAGQNFDDHAKFIMQFANQFCKNALPGMAVAGIVRSFTTYIIGSSAPKMFHRLNHPKYSQPYFDAIVQLPTNDVGWVGKESSSPNPADFSFIKILHSSHGIRFLQKVQHDITQPSTDPHWTRVIAELPKSPLPRPLGLTAGSKAVYTEDTYREFHQLLCLGLMGYRASLNTLTIDIVRNYLLILHPLANSTAFADHISAITDANGLQGGGSSHAEECERPGYMTEALEVELLEHSADMDDTSPHARVSDIMNLSRLGARLPGPIELVIYTTPSAGDTMAPLMPVIEDLVNRNGLCLRVKGPDGNIRTHMDLVRTALDDLREWADPSVGRSLDLMCQGSGFNGQVHCEIALAALMFDPTPSGFPTCDKSVIGVSRHCCAVCSMALGALPSPLHPGRPIDVLGHHEAVVPCALPDNIPPATANFVSACFERLFLDTLRELCILNYSSPLRHRAPPTQQGSV